MSTNVNTSAFCQLHYQLHLHRHFDVCHILEFEGMSKYLRYSRFFYLIILHNKYEAL